MCPCWVSLSLSPPNFERQVMRSSPKHRPFERPRPGWSHRCSSEPPPPTLSKSESPAPGPWRFDDGNLMGRGWPRMTNGSESMEGVTLGYSWDSWRSLQIWKLKICVETALVPLLKWPSIRISNPHGFFRTSWYRPWHPYQPSLQYLDAPVDAALRTLASDIVRLLCLWLPNTSMPPARFARFASRSARVMGYPFVWTHTRKMTHLTIHSWGYLILNPLKHGGLKASVPSGEALVPRLPRAVVPWRTGGVIKISPSGIPDSKGGNHPEPHARKPA